MTQPPASPDAPTPPPSTSGEAGLSRPAGVFRSLGPAIIVASVVLGPGSILLASLLGVEFGYSVLWLPVLSTALMICLVAIAARLGVVYERTLCEELAFRLGRPAAAFVGVVVFLIIASFQTSNNAAILAAVDPLIELSGRDPQAVRGPGVNVAILLGLNGFIIAVLFGLRRLYGPLEKLMIALVLIMIVGFVVNLAFAAPSLLEIARGLVPTTLEPTDPDAPPPSIGRIIGFFATTVSIAGAFYQAYLVKEKGWGMGDIKRGMTDSFLGIAVLGVVSAIIMITAAAVLHGRVAAEDIGNAGDVALQLQPFFGSGAVVLFSAGLFAGAFSSFLVNAMIGGTLLSDGLGLGGRMDQRWPRVLTAVVLLLAMGITIVYGGERPVEVITFAQALTVLGLPVLALAMVYLVTRPELRGERAIPLWMKLVLGVGTLVVFALAGRTALNLYASLTGG